MARSPKPTRAGSIEEAVFVDLLRTTDILMRSSIGVLRADDLSPAQYNVLRILRGAPEGLPCGEIAKRMTTHDPDVTRLLDRMEKRDLISRARESRDRRVVVTRITHEGLKLVNGLDEPVQKIHRKLLGHLGNKGLRRLRELLATARERAE